MSRAVKAALLTVTLSVVGGNLACVAQPLAGGNAQQAVAVSAAKNQSAVPTCVVALPSAWTKAFASGTINRKFPSAVVAHPTAGTGGPVAVAEYGAAWSGLELLWPSGTTSKVRSFADPKRDQVFGASWDGRFLVWSEVHSVYSWDGWDLWSWDKQTRRTRKIASALKHRGKTVSGPMQYPVTYAGKAYWAQGLANGTARIRETVLATGVSRNVVFGHVTAPVVVHGQLLWLQSPSRGALARIRLLNLSNLKPAPVPNPLRGVAGPNWIRAFGDRLVWVSTDYTSLYTWRWGDTQEPQLLASVGPLDHIGEPQVAGDLVVWAGDRAMFAQDLGSGVRTQLTKAWGSVMTSGTTLAVSWPSDPNSKSATGIRLAVIDARHLPKLPEC